jgi:hypothetical protein
MNAMALDPSDYDFEPENAQPPKDDLPEYKPPSSPLRLVQPATEPNPPPHSVGSEKSILSLYWAWPETRPAIQQAGISEDHFYSPGNRVIWNALAAHPDADLPLLAQRLLDSGQLDRAGGATTLMDVHNYCPSPQYLDQHLAVVLQKYSAREAITKARKLIEDIEASPGEVQSIISHAANSIAKAAEQASKKSLLIRGVMSFPTTIPKEACLLGNGWFRRGDIGTFISTAGAGKSVAVTQMSMAWGIGRTYMGIKPQQPLRIILFSGEDDEATIGQMREGFRKHALEVVGGVIDDKLLHVLTKSLRTEFSREFVGDAFHAHLDQMLTAEPADLIIINPLMSYIGGEIVSNAPTFLRIGLMPILQKHNCGCLIAHHTGKMAKDGWDNTDDIYAAIGGSEMANIPRATLTMRPTPADGVVVVKVGKRTSIGWKNAEGKHVTDYFMRRSDDPELPAWLPIAYEDASELMASGSKPDAKKGRTPRTDEVKTVILEELSTGAVRQSALAQTIAGRLNLSEKTVRNVIAAMMLGDRSIGQFSEKNPNGGKPMKWICLIEQLPQYSQVERM